MYFVIVSLLLFLIVNQTSIIELSEYNVVVIALFYIIYFLVFTSIRINIKKTNQNIFNQQYSSYILRFQQLSQEYENLNSNKAAAKNVIDWIGVGVALYCNSVDIGKLIQGFSSDIVNFFADSQYSQEYIEVKNQVHHGINLYNEEENTCNSFIFGLFVVCVMFFFFTYNNELIIKNKNLDILGYVISKPASVKNIKKNQKYPVLNNNGNNTEKSSFVSFQTNNEVKTENPDFNNGDSLNLSKNKTFETINDKYSSVNNKNEYKTSSFDYEKNKNEGVKYFNSKNYLLAMDKFSKIIEHNPDDGEAYNYLGNCYYFLKNYEKAIENYKKAVDIKRDDVKALLNLGLAHFIKHDIENAVRYFEKVLMIAPDDFRAYNYLGMIYESQKDYSNSAKFYFSSLKLGQDNILSSLEISLSRSNCGHNNEYKYLSDYYKRKGDIKKAKKYLDMSYNY